MYWDLGYTEETRRFVGFWKELFGVRIRSGGIVGRGRGTARVRGVVRTGFGGFVEGSVVGGVVGWVYSVRG